MCSHKPDSGTAKQAISTPEEVRVPPSCPPPFPKPPPRVLAEFSSTFLAAPSSRLPRGRSFPSLPVPVHQLWLQIHS